MIARAIVQKIERVVDFLRRVLSKPPHVIVFRAKQALILKWMKITKQWDSLNREINRFFTDKNVLCNLGTQIQKQPLLISTTAVRAISRHARSDKAWADKVLQGGWRVAQRRFSILGAPVPSAGPWPWDTDWRYGRKWPQQYFKTYNFYEPNRPNPYDVKLPWELGRLSFVTQLLQNLAIEENKDFKNKAVSIIRNWSQQNPLAHSVNWYPMEVAMRSVVLVLITEMLTAMDMWDAVVDADLLVELARHGEFIWRTLEYTDVRGNHYAAEVVSLLLIGLSIDSQYTRAKKWTSFAKKNIEQEINEQFLVDGVHFEKSVPYHRLVLELFMLAAIALRRRGEELSKESQDRLRAAAEYLLMVRQPDGLSPVIGDNDDGHILCWDFLPLRNHQAVLDVVACHFHDESLRVCKDTSLAAFWLFGEEANKQWQKMSNASSKHKYFEVGGMVVSKTNLNYLCYDVGEVGTRGRGGHGHNDLFSFDLLINGDPIFCDSGCSVYTGDFQLRNRYRSTSSHNCLQVDGKEMAIMRGMWQISDSGRPKKVSARQIDHITTIDGIHAGYHRLKDAVTHRRRFQFDSRNGFCECTDFIDCLKSHIVTRYFHFSPGILPIVQGNQAVIKTPNARGVLVWNKGAVAEIVEGVYSEGYGKNLSRNVLVLQSEITGPAVLTFTLNF